MAMWGSQCPGRPVLQSFGSSAWRLRLLPHRQVRRLRRRRRADLRCLEFLLARRMEAASGRHQVLGEAFPDPEQAMGAVAINSCAQRTVVSDRFTALTLCANSFPFARRAFCHRLKAGAETRHSMPALSDTPTLQEGVENKDVENVVLHHLAS